MKMGIFNLICYIPVNHFSVMSGRSSWVEPILSRGYGVLHAHGHKAVPPVRPKPTTPQSRVKHSTTELQRSMKMGKRIQIDKMNLTDFDPQSS